LFLEEKEANRSCRDPKAMENNDLGQNTEMIETIRGGIDSKELNTGYRKAQIRQPSRVMAAKELKPLMRPIIIVSLKDVRSRQTSHNDALVIQLKITTIMVC